jgi:hypothetical protein
MSSHEFAEWMAFARVEPIGEDRDDYRLAYLMSFLANVVSDRSRKNKEKPRVFELSDFLPKFWEAEIAAAEAEAGQPVEPERQVWEQQLQYVELWNIALRGKDIRQ